MKISNNKVVSLTYDLSVLDDKGEKSHVETAGTENPMVFLYGVSGLPDKFEENLDGLEKGETFSFALESEDGYGDYDENALINIPKDVFEVDGSIPDGMLEEGNFIPMSDSEGNQMQGRVVEVKATEVQMDFNHPLAGKTMHFDGKVVDVREATPEELAHGHVHGEHGHHH